MQGAPPRDTHSSRRDLAVDQKPLDVEACIKRTLDAEAKAKQLQAMSVEKDQYIARLEAELSLLRETAAGIEDAKAQSQRAASAEAIASQLREMLDAKSNELDQLEELLNMSSIRAVTLRDTLQEAARLKDDVRERDQLIACLQADSSAAISRSKSNAVLAEEQPQEPFSQRSFGSAAPSRRPDTTQGHYEPPTHMPLMRAASPPRAVYATQQQQQRSSFQAPATPLHRNYPRAVSPVHGLAPVLRAPSPVHTRREMQSPVAVASPVRMRPELAMAMSPKMGPPGYKEPMEQVADGKAVNPDFWSCRVN
mmetsp:Transcript_89377/g.208076  ORF Transcript_89377/g.208076 Transcript_89377/m.208076 type:complete len:309 (-) Transcript_89377:58-984(-)